MRLKIQTAPAAEPLDATTLKRHARIEHTGDDTYIAEMLYAARERLERDTGRALITQTWDLTLDDFPNSSDEPLYLPKPPLSSVTHVKYYDTSLTQQTWDSDEYDVDASSKQRRGRILPADGYTWPTVGNRVGAVEVRFVCGYGAAGSSLPYDLLHALKVLAATYYENREDTAAGVNIRQVPGPAAYKRLIYPFIVREF